MGLIARLKSLFHKKSKPSQVKIGLALGSGGAKGMAHLGAIKAFEEAGIRFSYVAGTSIGSIVGALYAKGYSSSDMVRIIENLNRKEFAKNIRPFSDMAFAEEFLSGYLEGDFNTLSVPFAAWATDGATNEGFLLNEGNLARALTASSAMPPIFKGVEINGRKYFDGAFTNAIPADVVKQMGAQFVIGIDLSAYTKPEAERSRLSRLVGSALDKMSPVKNKEDNKSRGYANADVMLRPDLEDYQPTDVAREAMDKMFEIGYEEALAHMDGIKEALADFGKKK